MLKTKAEVWTALGGALGISRLTGLDYGVVENWKRARTFPARVHAVMTWALKRKRMSASPSLWGQVTTAEMERAAA